MAVALPVAVLLLAQAAPAAAQEAKTTTVRPEPTSPSSAATVPDCPPSNSDGQTIVICTERPQGYRLDPDIMEARREAHGGSPPPRPGGKAIPDCTNVGPAPCMTAGVDLLGAVLTAAQMAERLAKGQEVGSMFVTDPHPSEYQLYQMAKARRQAEEAQKVADTKAAAARAARQSAPPPASSTQSAQPSSH
jgi:hypothetical protein